MTARRWRCATAVRSCCWRTGGGRSSRSRWDLDAQRRWHEGRVRERSDGKDAGDMDFFSDFSLERVDVGTATLRVRVGGSGPCVLLLHGHPRTHTTWYRAAPLLAEAGFTVVCPDLPGYGESRRVVGDFSKKAMAGDLVRLMERFGSFSV